MPGQLRKGAQARVHARLLPGTPAPVTLAELGRELGSPM